MTFDYADALVVIGPLAPQAEAHSYDLCALHAKTFTVPRGWQIIRPASTQSW